MLFIKYNYNNLLLYLHNLMNLILNLFIFHHLKSKFLHKDNLLMNIYTQDNNFYKIIVLFFQNHYNYKFNNCIFQNIYHYHKHNLKIDAIHIILMQQHLHIYKIYLYNYYLSINKKQIINYIIINLMKPSTVMNH